MAACGRLARPPRGAAWFTYSTGGTPSLFYWPRLGGDPARV